MREIIGIILIRAPVVAVLTGLWGYYHLAYDRRLQANVFYFQALA